MKRFLGVVVFAAVIASAYCEPAFPPVMPKAKGYDRIITDQKFYTNEKGRALAKKYHKNQKALVDRIRGKFPHSAIEFSDPPKDANAIGLYFGFKQTDPTQPIYWSITAYTAIVQQGKFETTAADLFNSHVIPLVKLMLEDEEVIGDEGVVGLCASFTWPRDRKTAEILGVWASKADWKDLAAGKKSVEEFSRAAELFGMYAGHPYRQIKELDLRPSDQRKPSAEKPSTEQTPSVAAVKETRPPPSPSTPGDPIGVRLESKRFHKMDVMAGDGSDRIDLTLYFFNHGKKDFKAFKGVVTFKDEFGDVIQNVTLKFENEFPAGKSSTWEGGIDYNQFKDNHRRLATIDPNRLKVSWITKQVIYPDGTAETLSKD